MLKILLDRYPFAFIFLQNRFGKTMMDYLMKQRPWKVIQLIKMTLKTVLPVGMCDDCSLAQWRRDLLDRIESTLWEGDNHTRWMCYQAIMKHFAHFIKMESSSILELALWKMKIGELHSDAGMVDRTNCRWNCGSDVVMGNVMGYSWNDQSEACLSSMMLPLCSCVGDKAK